MSRLKLRPDQKVDAAINMTDVCVNLCVDSVRDEFPLIREDELAKRVKERIEFGKRVLREVQTLDTFEGFVKRIVSCFNSMGVDYMFTGALAASYYGTPRTTMDADVVIKISSRPKEIDKLVHFLKQTGLDAEARSINRALESGFRIATFRDEKSPFTLDAIFSTTKLEKRSGTILGLRTFYQTPEDLLLAKLRMIKATIPRERAFKDVADVEAILKFTRVNMNTLKRKASKNTTISILNSIMGKRKIDRSSL